KTRSSRTRKLWRLAAANSLARWATRAVPADGLRAGRLGSRPSACRLSMVMAMYPPRRLAAGGAAPQDSGDSRAEWLRIWVRLGLRHRALPAKRLDRCRFPASCGGRAGVAQSMGKNVGVLEAG